LDRRSPKVSQPQASAAISSSRTTAMAETGVSGLISAAGSIPASRSRRAGFGPNSAIRSGTPTSTPLLTQADIGSRDAFLRDQPNAAGAESQLIPHVNCYTAGTPPIPIRSSRAMTASVRPLFPRLFAVMLFVSALLTGFVGLSAPGYFVPAACLLLQAALLWTGRLRRLFTALLAVNLASGIVLILVLWLGDVLGDRKLDISGVALLVNLATGGPLTGVFGGPLLALLRFGPLPAWFRAHGARLA